MAMRCFGRAFALEDVLAAVLGLTAGRPRPLDLMVLRADDLAVVLWPAHFFFTAVLAAALEVAFCLAIGALPFVGYEKLPRGVQREFVLPSNVMNRMKRGVNRVNTQIQVSIIIQLA